MKYILLMLLALLAFQGSYSQIKNVSTATIDFNSLEEQAEEEEASGVDEAIIIEEENASGVDEVIEEEENEAQTEEQEEEAIEVESEMIEEIQEDELLSAVETLEDILEEAEELQPDAAGNVNVSVTKWLSNDFNKQVLNFVIQWQLYSLEGYDLIPTYYAWQLDKVNFIQFNKQENVWRINVRIHDVEISNDFFTGHSVVQYSQTPNKQIDILRSKYGLNSDVAAPFTDPDVLDKLTSGWSSIAPDVAQEDPVFNDLLDYAVKTTIQRAVPRILPQGDWSLKSLTAANIQAKDNGNVYHLNVLLAGPNGETAKGEIAVLKKPDGTKSFISYGFDGLDPATA